MAPYSIGNRNKRVRRLLDHWTIFAEQRKLSPMRLLIVDDHPVVRAGISALLREAEPGAVVLEAADLGAGLRAAEERPPLDVVLLDLRLPDVSGNEALTAFRARHPGLPLIVLSSSESPGDVRSALAAGARGFVPKSAGRTTLVEAMRLVLRGEVYVPPLMLGLHAKGIDADRLTQRQLEVLRMLASGQTNKEIGAALALSEKTVKAHVSAVFRALDVVNRTQAAQAARTAGLL